MLPVNNAHIVRFEPRCVPVRRWARTWVNGDRDYAFVCVPKSDLASHDSIGLNVCSSVKPSEGGYDEIVDEQASSAST